MDRNDSDCNQGLEAEDAAHYNQRSPGYDPAFSPLSPTAPQVIEQGYPPENYYPATNQFPPPPAANYSPQPAYNPADFAPPHGQQQDYAYAHQQGYAPPQGVFSPPPDAAYPPGRGRGGGENVSPGYAPDARTAEEGG